MPTSSVEPRFRRVALIGKLRSAEIAALAAGARRVPAPARLRDPAERETAAGLGARGADYETIGKGADLAIVIGGDGTMLAAARKLVRHHVPLIGVNQGRVGFMTDIGQAGHAGAASARSWTASTRVEERSLLDAEMLRGGALDAAHHGAERGGGRQGRARTADRVRALARRRVRLQAARRRHDRRDPTGSTAYALSAQGPILHPAVPALALVPLNPHTLSARPVSVSDRSVIEIALVRRARRARAFRRLPLADMEEGDRVVLAPLRGRGALRSPAGLPLLRHPAREAALERGSGEGRRGLMLRALELRDFVIVERVSLELDAGFTVLTGETGAGKSILDRRHRAAGRRARRRRDRARRRRARRAVGGVRHRAAPRCAPGWRSASSPATTGKLILRRTIDRSGRSRCFINGHAATLAQLTRGRRVPGRHPRPARAPVAAARRLAACASRCARRDARRWRDETARGLEGRRPGAGGRRGAEEFRGAHAERAELQEQAADLKKLGPREGEWAQVCAEQTRLAHGSSLVAGAQSALEALAEADGACLPQLSGVAARLRTLSAHDAAAGRDRRAARVRRGAGRRGGALAAPLRLARRPGP